MVCVCAGGTLGDVLLLGIRRLFFMFILFIFPLNAKIPIDNTKMAQGASGSGCCGILHRSPCRTKALTHPPLLTLLAARAQVSLQELLLAKLTCQIFHLLQRVSLKPITGQGKSFNIQHLYVSLETCKEFKYHYRVPSCN